MGASKEEAKKKNEEGAALFLGGKAGIPEFPSPCTCFSLASNRATIQPLLFFTQ